MYIYSTYNSPNNKKYMKSKYFQNFNGNINKFVGSFKLGENEFAQVTGISSKYRQLNFLFKSAGNYMTDLFKKGIAFLIPIGISGFSLQNSLNSEDVPNIKIEKTHDEKSDKLMNFILGKNEDFAKLVVFQNGTVEVIADEDLPECDLDRYLTEINTNHDKFFGTVYSRTNDALHLISEIINRKENYQFDITSEADVKRIVKQFIDEKRRISLLSDITSYRRFWNEFELEDGAVKSLERGILKDKDISFSFSNLENFCFNGMQITVTDEENGTKQGFVATTDGKIYKSKVYKKEDFEPRKVWLIRNLKPLSAEELNNPDLQYMFNYGYSHVDKAYKCMLKILYEQNKIFLDSYADATEQKKQYIDEILTGKMHRIDKFNNMVEKERNAIATKSELLAKGALAGDLAKTARIYHLTPKELALVQQLATYGDRISIAYIKKMQYQRNELNAKCGFIRHKNINGVIFQNILENDNYYLGMGRYIATPHSKELLSFGIFDKKLNEIARFKVETNGEAKLIMRPSTPDDVAVEIEQMIKEKMQNSLYEKLIEQLETAIFYHENKTKVDTHIKHSYHPITLSQAVKELKGAKEYYHVNTEKFNRLKDNLENIREVYRKHQLTAYKWQKIYFPEVENNSKKYMYSKLENPNINYEFVFVNNDLYSGLKILTRNENGIFINGYIIENDGNIYKLMSMPNSSEYKHLYIERSNFSQLDDEAVKAEHVDLIFDKICEDIENYNNFCNECLSEMHDKGQVPHEKIIQIALKYKPTLQYFIEPPKSPATPKIKRTEKIAKTSKIKKTGRPKKKPIEIKYKIDKTTTPIETPDTTVRESSTVKPFTSLSMEDVLEKINTIFKTPYEKRSPHLIHDVTDRGIFSNRYSVNAPDGAWVTVTMIQSGMSYHYPSIRVQKDNEIMYLNIDPDSGRIFRCDENNNIMHDDETGRRLHISKDNFIAKNPLAQYMSIYFDELFAQKPDAKRKTIKFQIFKKQDLVAKQAIRDFERAMRKAELEKMAKEMEKELEAEETIESIEES